MKKALRTQKLAIDIPVPGAEPWINCMLQHIVVDDADNVVQVVERAEQLHRRSTEIIFDTVTVTDPVTQLPVTISGAGMQVAIEKMVSQWIIEDYNRKGISTFVNEHGRIIIVE